MTYQIRRHTNVNAFAQLALPFLLRNEPANNLQIGLTQRALGGEALGFDLLATIQDAGGHTVAVATLNPGRNLLVSEIPNEAVVPLAKALSKFELAIPGVHGPQDAVDALARRLKRVAASRAVRDIWRLDTIRHQPPVVGWSNVATSTHASLVCGWLGSFCAEVTDNMPLPSQERVLQLTTHANVFLWYARDRPVSMAAIVRESAAGATVSYVYTPTEHRGQGFASCCVASVCAEILSRGKRFATLYSDPANDPANRVYERVGFRRVATTVQLTFD